MIISILSGREEKMWVFSNACIFFIFHNTSINVAFFEGGIIINGTLHLAAGTTIGIFCGMFTYQDPKAAAIFASGCAIGSILPDIDSPKAMISKACQPISILVNHYFGHRGFTHSPFVVAILIVITQLYVKNSLADFLHIIV